MPCKQLAVGSIPIFSTYRLHSSKVEHVLGKDEARVQFPLEAPRGCLLNGEDAAFQADAGRFDPGHPHCADEADW